MTRTASWLLCCMTFANLTGLAHADDLAIVRLVVKSSAGKTVSTMMGTHIGDGLILTSGLGCRAASTPGTKVSADLVSSKTQMTYRTVSVTPLDFEPAADVGLMQFDEPNVLKATKDLAPRGDETQTGDRVRAHIWMKESDRRTLFQKLQGSLSGAPPYGDRVELHTCSQRITNANLRTKADDSLNQAQGTAGGPLLRLSDGAIVGITGSEVVSEDRGPYCGLEPIYRLLDRLGKRVPTDKRAK